MISGLDDRDDPQSLVALEAMAGLVKLLDLVEPDDLRPVLLHVAIRIRPFFDSVGWGSTALPCPALPCSQALLPLPQLQVSPPPFRSRSRGYHGVLPSSRWILQCVGG